MTTKKPDDVVLQQLRVLWGDRDDDDAEAFAKSAAVSDLRAAFTAVRPQAGDEAFDKLIAKAMQG